MKICVEAMPLQRQQKKKQTLLVTPETPLCWDKKRNFLAYSHSPGENKGKGTQPCENRFILSFFSLHHHNFFFLPISMFFTSPFLFLASFYASLFRNILQQPALPQIFYFTPLIRCPLFLSFMPLIPVPLFLFFHAIRTTPFFFFFFGSMLLLNAATYPFSRLVSIPQP